jgi:hypothetical protein
LAVDPFGRFFNVVTFGHFGRFLSWSLLLVILAKMQIVLMKNKYDTFEAWKSRNRLWGCREDQDILKAAALCPECMIVSAHLEFVVPVRDGYEYLPSIDIPSDIDSFPRACDGAYPYGSCVEIELESLRHRKGVVLSHLDSMDEMYHISGDRHCFHDELMLVTPRNGDTVRKLGSCRRGILLERIGEVAIFREDTGYVSRLPLSSLAKIACDSYYKPLLPGTCVSFGSPVKCGVVIVEKFEMFFVSNNETALYSHELTIVMPEVGELFIFLTGVDKGKVETLLRPYKGRERIAKYSDLHLDLETTPPGSPKRDREDDEVEITGEETWEQRDKRLRACAVVIDI